jgi:hypothetical protein
LFHKSVGVASESIDTPWISNPFIAVLGTLALSPVLQKQYIGKIFHSK